MWLSHASFFRAAPHTSAVSWVEGGGATVTRVRARDGSDIDKDDEKMLEQGHVRALPRVQHEVEDLLAACEASHPGGHVPDLDKRVVPELRPQREHALAAHGLVTKFVDGAHRLLKARLAGGLLVADRALASLTRCHWV